MTSVSIDPLFHWKTQFQMGKRFYWNFIRRSNSSKDWKTNHMAEDVLKLRVWMIRAWGHIFVSQAVTNMFVKLFQDFSESCCIHINKLEKFEQIFTHWLISLLKCSCLSSPNALFRIFCSLTNICQLRETRSQLALLYQQKQYNLLNLVEKKNCGE